MLTNEEKRDQWRQKKRKRQELERGQKKQIKEKREREKAVGEERKVSEKHCQNEEVLITGQTQHNFQIVCIKQTKFLNFDREWKSNQK